MTELWAKNLYSGIGVEALSLNDTESGVPRESTKTKNPESLTLAEIIALKGTESFYRFHRDRNKKQSWNTRRDPRLEN